MEKALVFKLSVSVVLAFTGVLAASRVSTVRWSNAQFTRIATLAAFGLPLLVCIGLYGFMGVQVPSDVPAYYYPQGLSVLEGKLPYRDFASSYAPLFSYVSAGLITVWASPKVFVLFAVFANALALPLWLRAARSHFDEDLVRRATCLYIFNPGVFITVLVGQNQVWGALFLAAALCLSVQKRPLLSGLVLGVGFVTVKLLMLLFVPMLLALDRQRFRWILGFCLPTAVVYGLFLLLRADILSPLKGEGMLATGGNLPFLLSAFGIELTADASKLWMAGLGLLMLIGTLAFLVRADRTPPSCAWFFTALLMAVFLGLSRKSYSSYLALCFFAVCISIAKSSVLRGSAFLLLSLFFAALALEPSLYHRILDPLPERTLAGLLTTSAVFSPPRMGLAILFAVECAVVAGYGWMGWKAFRGCFRTTSVSCAH